MFNIIHLNDFLPRHLTARLMLLILFLVSGWTAAEQPPIETGPAIGSQLPALTLLDQYGDHQQIANFMGQKGAVIVLFRSADWCPFCKRHLLELNPMVKKFRQLGYGVVAISYDKPKILRQFSQQKKLHFALLSDQNVASFIALKVVNQEIQTTHKHYGIPYPGVIVVDSGGRVAHKHFFEGYKKRVKFKQLYQQLKSL